MGGKRVQQGLSDLRNGKPGQFKLNIRPFAKELILKLSKHFNVLIFTASQQSYADPLIDIVDPEKVVEHRLYRKNCTLVNEKVYIKNLEVVRGRQLKDMVLIDNMVYNYVAHFNNGIPVEPFTDQADDNALVLLYNYLLGFAEVEDVRVKIKADLQYAQFFKK